jgi:hypothetical protein
MVDAARQAIILDSAAATLDSGKQACPNISSQVELGQASGLLVDDYHSGSDIGSAYEVADLDFYQAAASQLAIDCQSNNALSRRRASRSRKSERLRFASA